MLTRSMGRWMLFFSLTLVGREALAEEFRAHVTAGAAHAVSSPQDREFGWGGLASGSLELPLGRRLGVEAKVSGIVLSEGEAPRDPALARRSTGLALYETVGLRARPWMDVAGPWASLGAGAMETGRLFRFAFAGAVGWDFRLSKESRWDLGPVVEYVQAVEPGGSLRPEDARILSLGLHLGFGVAPPPKERIDRDGDGVYDDEDACPDVAGLRTSDPKTNGCPRADRDSDTVYDDEDACPDVAGIRTSDPKTNGCPRGDRDDDAVYDDEDACPDVAGIRTSDPKTSGCPRADRDSDGVYDDEDACPDVAGLRTGDPKTSGCPAEERIHVEQDRIMLDDVINFDLDSPRVRHASWPVVERLAKFLNATPDIREISIEGHTDATGEEAHNLKLSRQRAESVVRLLVRYGVDASRLKAEAFGRSRLAVETSGPERKNRRVEFWITRSGEGKGESSDGVPEGTRKGQR